MRFFATLLSVCFLVISTNVCCDDFGIADDGWRYQTEQHEHSGDSSHDCLGVCSPFCVCGSCAGFTVVPYFSDFQLKPMAFSKENISYLSKTYLSSSLKGVWQPPKSI
jgi:hypothetical protein